jgi:hypothetical protein
MHCSYLADQKADWITEFEDLEVDEMWQKFCSLTNQAIDLFVPLGYNKTKKTLVG